MGSFFTQENTMEPIGKLPIPRHDSLVLRDELEDLAQPDELESPLQGILQELRSRPMLSDIDLAQIALARSLIWDMLEEVGVPYGEPVKPLGDGSVIHFRNVVDAHSPDGHSGISVFIGLTQGPRPQIQIKTRGFGVRPRNRDGSSIWSTQGSTGLPRYDKMIDFIVGYLEDCQRTGLDRRKVR